MVKPLYFKGRGRPKVLYHGGFKAMINSNKYWLLREMHLASRN